MMLDDKGGVVTFCFGDGLIRIMPRHPPYTAILDTRFNTFPSQSSLIGLHQAYLLGQIYPPGIHLIHTFIPFQRYFGELRMNIDLNVYIQELISFFASVYTIFKLLGIIYSFSSNILIHIYCNKARQYFIPFYRYFGELRMNIDMNVYILGILYHFSPQFRPSSSYQVLYIHSRHPLTRRKGIRGPTELRIVISQFNNLYILCFTCFR